MCPAKSALPRLLNNRINNMTKTGGQPTRLYANGAILGYKRGLRNQYNHTSLIKIKGVDSKEDVEFYLGKRVAYITKVSTPGGKTGSKFRVNWGRVCRGHGSNGVVRCKFARDLPPQSIGGRVRVMLYPSRV
jgi:large subunit ribosomal protein L35Ae